jgi:hypothetical protein
MPVPHTPEPAGCLLLLLRLFGFGVGESAGSRELPYRLRDDFLSPAEASFFRVLRQAVQQRALVFAKVNLADLFFVTRPQENRADRNRIDRKHVDFLLVHPDTLQPLAGVELDDASHQRPQRAERDRFVDQVFQAAGLPLIRVAARSSYDPSALAAELSPHLNGHRSTVAAPAPIAGSTAPVCPKCGVGMVQRVASKGANKGRPFWGCLNYPKCREIA